MSIALEVPDDALASRSLSLDERERYMQIELACRYYAKGWLFFCQAARFAGLGLYAFGIELGNRGIPWKMEPTKESEDLARASQPKFHASEVMKLLLEASGK